MVLTKQQEDKNMPIINGKHYTEQEISDIKSQTSSSDFDKFLISGVIGAITGSSLIGGILGGDFLGGFVGDLLEGDDDSIF